MKLAGRRAETKYKTNTKFGRADFNAQCHSNMKPYHGIPYTAKENWSNTNDRSYFGNKTDFKWRLPSSQFFLFHTSLCPWLDESLT